MTSRHHPAKNEETTKDCHVGQDSGSSNHKSNNDCTGRATMDLFDKFAEVNRQIEAAKRQRKAASQEADAAEKAVSALQEERQSMQDALKNAAEEADTYHIQCQQLYKALEPIRKEHTHAAISRDRAVQKRDALRNSLLNHRKEFLAQSERFRSNCKRMRLVAKGLKLEHASMCAHAVVKGLGDGSIFDGIDDRENEQLLMGNFDYDMVANDNNDKEQEPVPEEEWMSLVLAGMDKNDTELKTALSLCQSKHKAYTAALRDLENIKTSKKTVEDKSLERQEQIKQLQRQLDRIRKDISGLQSKTDELLELTEEAKILSESFAKQSKLRKRHQTNSKRTTSTVTPSSGNLEPRCLPPQLSNIQKTGSGKRPTRNPYSRAPSGSTRSCERRGQGRGGVSDSSGSIPSSSVPFGHHIDSCSASAGMSAATTTTHYDPTNHQPALVFGASGGGDSSAKFTCTSSLPRHHRRHRDRQFGSSVVVTGGEKIAEVETSATTAFVESVVPESCVQGMKSYETTPDPLQGSTRKSASSLGTFLDEDEEDDGLLSFVAFPRGK